MRSAFGVSCAVTLAAVTMGCGGSGSTTSPSSPPTATTTITITSAGVSPKNIVVSAGSQVTFINNDSRVHEMDSDPHPEHTDCPPINQVGTLNAGQSRQTGNLTVVRVCGFHDHLNDSNQSLRGTITIQ